METKELIALEEQLELIGGAKISEELIDNAEISEELIDNAEFTRRKTTLAYKASDLKRLSA